MKPRDIRKVIIAEKRKESNRGINGAVRSTPLFLKTFENENNNKSQLTSARSDADNEEATLIDNIS